MRLDISATSAHQMWLFNDALLFFSKSTLFVQKLGNHLSGLMLLTMLLLPAQATLAEETALSLTPINQAIAGIISTKQHPLLKPSQFVNRASDLDELYKLSGYQPLWLGPTGTEKNLSDALDLLNNAAVNGLNKADYDTDTLLEKRQAVQALSSDAYQAIAEYDTAVSLAMLRFFHDLQYGRVNPHSIHYNLKLREKKLTDLPVLITQHLQQQNLPALSQVLEPSLRQYQKLKSALAQYRTLANQSAPFQLTVNNSIRPGDSLPQANDLKRWLITLGDLQDSSNTTQPSTHYTGELVQGVKKFQLRHGLAADGVIGRTTAKELTTSLPERVKQIELAMERLRWLPELGAGPSIIVNIPSFELWAFEDINNPNAKVENIRVVVGKAMKNQTPVLMATMSFIDFAPYWNVPYNIVKDELLPKLINNPGYLEKENMELVSSSGVTSFSEASITQLKQGSVRIRQRPGKKNALGRVKFLFPNKDDVYLHDTPANSLFSRSRRDFSHGCVRVAKPEQLAEFALKNEKNWDKSAIQKAMQSSKMQRVILKQPIPVLFFYTTAFFDQNDQLVFYPDIYAHDSVLLEALKNPVDVPDEALFASKPLEQPVATETETLKTVEVAQ